MKEYTVAYIKNGEEYGDRDIYIACTTISEIVDEVIYELNLYGEDCEYITIFDANDEEDIAYYKVVNIDGKYQLEGIGRNHVCIKSDSRTCN